MRYLLIQLKITKLFLSKFRSFTTFFSKNQLLIRQLSLAISLTHSNDPLKTNTNKLGIIILHLIMAVDVLFELKISITIVSEETYSAAFSFIYKQYYFYNIFKLKQT